MEYDDSELENSNLSGAADLSHLLEVSATEGEDSFGEFSNNTGDEDSVNYESGYFIGHQVNDDSTSAMDVTTGEAEWLDSDSVPEAWKVKEFVTKAGQKLEHIQSPQGQFFPGRKAAVDWMREQGIYGNEDIELMQSKLKIKWTDDDPTLPTGWQTRTSQIKTKTGLTEMQWFLSPEGKMFRGRKSVLKYIAGNPGLFDPDEIRRFKSVQSNPNKKFSAEYDWNDNDPTLPDGWRSAVIQMNSFGKIVDSLRFLSPDGRFCTSRVEAIKYLMKDGAAHPDDMARMTNGLLSDGWETDPKLPEGWFMKPDKCRGKRKEAHYNYLSADFQYHRSTKAAVAHMKAIGLGEDAVQNLISKTHDEGKKLRPDKYDWIEGDESVPEGWKLRIVHCSNGLEREFFLAPDGSSYSGRKQAIEAMNKHGGYDIDDIRKMESGCKVKWYDDDPTLPPNWKTRHSEINSKNGKIPMQWFLNPEGKMFRGRKAALEEIQNSGKFSINEIRRFKFVIPEEKRQNYDWDDNDSSVPVGWLTTIITMNSFGKMVRSKRFLAPCGRFCSSRDDAIKYMMKEGIYTDEELDIMQSGFGSGEDTYDFDGNMQYGAWDMDDDGGISVGMEPTVEITAPADAEKRKWEDGEEGEDDDEDGAKKIKLEKEDYDDDGSADGYAIVKEEIPEEDDGGEYVPKVKITKVKSENVNDEDCFQLRSWRTGKRIVRTEVKDDSDDPDYRGGGGESSSATNDAPWEEDDTVPTGWLTRSYTNRAGQRVQNMKAPDGTFCAGRKSAIEYMETSAKFSLEDIELMQSGLKVQWTDGDSTVPEGWKSRITDVKTKTGSTSMQWFLSPDGKMFRGRKSALRYIETCDYYSKEEVRLFKSKPTTEKKFTKEYNWSEDEPHLPLGWKSTTIEMNSFGKIVYSTRFLAPDGRYCSNRLDALRYMVKENIFSMEDINIMKGGLQVDGWRQDAKSLPAGWYMKPRKDKINEATASYHYVSDTFQQFESTKSAIKFMKESHQYSDSDIAKLEAKISLEAKKLCPDKYEWLESDDNIQVPPGWKYRTVMCSNGLERQFFLAPDGSSYSGRKQAVDYMKKKKMPDEHIKLMEAGFKIQWFDDDSLPTGFKMRTTDMKTKNGTVQMQWFLSPEGKMFRGRKSTLEHITKSGKYSVEDIRKFRCSGETPTKSPYEWHEDPAVPKGWKTTMITVNSFGKNVLSKRYLSPDGRFCSSRIDALKYMKKENIFLESDVHEMKRGLLLEGWEENDFLPPDWFVKPDNHKSEEATFNYLAPDFTFLRSTKAAQTYMKNSLTYGQDHVDSLNALVDEGRKRIRLEKYGAKQGPQSDDTIPSTFKMKVLNNGPQQKIQLFAPDGNSFFCRRSALQHMIKEGYSVMEVEEMRNCLRFEGWEEDTLLPNSWRLRKSENSTGCGDFDYSLMSRTGELFNSMKTAIEWMESGQEGEYREEEIRSLRTLFDNESKQNRSMKYDWAEDDTVPTGWKTRVVDGKMRKKFFLAPDGSSFSCRRSGLQHMIKEGFSAEEIDAMRGMLVHEGWERGNFLPQDWLIRKSEGQTNGIYDVDYWYLSVEGNLFRSTKTVVEFMTENENYTQEDIDKISTTLEQERKVVRQQKYDWQDGDPTVPPSWKVRVIEGKTRKTFFLSEDGNQFACRRSAYQHMIKERYPEAQIVAMRECLVHEGWNNDAMLPPGWKVRKSEGSTNGAYDVNYYYIAVDGTMFHSTRAVINYMEKRPEYNEVDIKRIKTRLENETKKNRPQKYEWLMDENLPEGWKFRTIIKGGIRTDFILTAEGNQHQSRRAAIENMIKENFDPQAIYKMWGTLTVEGWVANEKLPKGWRVRSKDRLKDNWQFYFLSPQMEIFKSNKAVLDYITAQSETYTQEDYEKVKIYIEEEQRERRSGNYTWHDSKSLPEGWKMRKVVTNSNNVREFFLTPDGDHIAGRRKAIEVMKEKGIYDTRIINKMVKEMKSVSKKNQGKSSMSSKMKTHDDTDEEEEGNGDEWGQGQIPAGSQDWQEDNTNDDTIEPEYYGDDTMEDMVLEDEEQLSSDPVENIDIKDLVPEFEPVEITPVENQGNYSEEEDEEGFNDAEEITDDMLDESGQTHQPVNVEDIKIEPDINMAMFHQYM